MNGADFEYSIIEYSRRQCIVITDLNRGSKSVTNDIENVVAGIEQKENIKADDHLVVYRDSDGSWNGWDRKTGFIPLQSFNFKSALAIYIGKDLRKGVISDRM